MEGEEGGFDGGEVEGGVGMCGGLWGSGEVGEGLEE